MPKTEICSKNVNARLTGPDLEKLRLLATHARRPLSETLRVLVRLAEPVDVEPFRFGQAETS